MNPGIIVNFYKPDKEKCGCTVVYRQRIYCAWNNDFYSDVISYSQNHELVFHHHIS
jgi:hypothetical protein